MHPRNLRTLQRTIVIGLVAVLITLSTSVNLPATAAMMVDSKGRQRADKALRDGDYEGAEKMYRALLEKDSHDTRARLGLSQSLLKLRRLRDAYDHAARVILAHPMTARAPALLSAPTLFFSVFLNLC